VGTEKKVIDGNPVLKKAIKNPEPIMKIAERSGIFKTLFISRNTQTIPADTAAKERSGRINPGIALLTKINARPSCTPLMTGSGMILLTRSIHPKNPMHKHITPIKIPEAAIRWVETDSAIAMAPTAFSGSTGIGIR
jgi:hypothetical protein